MKNKTDFEEWVKEVIKSPEFRRLTQINIDQESGRCEIIAPKLSRYMSGEAGESEVVEVRRHLAHCVDCLKLELHSEKERGGLEQ